MSLGHAAISAFPLNLGVHISAIPLGDFIVAENQFERLFLTVV